MAPIRETRDSIFLMLVATQLAYDTAVGTVKGFDEDIRKESEVTSRKIYFSKVKSIYPDTQFIEFEPDRFMGPDGILGEVNKTVEYNEATIFPHALMVQIRESIRKV